MWPSYSLDANVVGLAGQRRHGIGQTRDRFPNWNFQVVGDFMEPLDNDA